MKRRTIFGIVGFLAASSLALAEPRTWTSKDGTATLDGEFVKSESGKVTIILRNGRSQVIESRFLSDADLAWIEQNAGAKAGVAGEAAATPPTAKIPSALAGHLIDHTGKEAELGAGGSKVPRYYLFYYSASWCGPCQAFTPELIRFYKRMKPKADFEVILVPSDRSLEDEIAYMKEHRMPWLGIRWATTGVRGVPHNTSRGIPAMNLVDADGELLLSTADVHERSEFLEKAKSILSKDSSS